jgi:hypothetical protein
MLPNPNWMEFIQSWAAEMANQFQAQGINAHAIAHLNTCEIAFESNSDILYTLPHNVDGEDLMLYVIRYGDVSVYGNLDEFACTSGPNPITPSVVHMERNGERVSGQKFQFN